MCPCLAHALQVFHRLRDRGVVGIGWANVRGMLVFDSRAGIRCRSILSAEPRYRAWSLGWASPISFSLIYLFLLLQSLDTACGIEFEVYGIAWSTECIKMGMWWWVFPHPYIKTTSRCIPYLLPEKAKATDNTLWVSSCLHLHICVFCPLENDLRCAQKWEIQTKGFWIFYPSLSFYDLKFFPLHSLQERRGVLFLPTSDVYVRSFLYILYTLIKLYCTKALSDPASSLAPDWILSPLEAKNPSILSFSNNLSLSLWTDSAVSYPNVRECFILHFI